MAGVFLWAWDSDNNEWVKVKTDDQGRLYTVAVIDELDDIGDVYVPTPTDGYILYWNAGNSRWECKAVPTAAHKDTHDPQDGSDKLDTAAPVKVGSANAEGSSHSFARADHVHEREHAIYTDAAAKAAAVQAGAITDGVTKAPTHDAVFDVKTMVEEHSTRHENAGDDEINVGGLSGQLADDQHVKDAEVLAVAATKLHESTHVSGGADDIDSALAIAAMANLSSTKIWQGNVSNRPVEVDMPTGNGATIIRKPDDEIVNNNETLQNDDDLVLAVGANDVWLIHLLWFFLSPSTGVDIDYAFAVPSGGEIRVMTEWEVTTDNLHWFGTTERTMDVLTTESYAQVFCLYIGGGTGGNLQFQWAQHVATVEDTKVKANSLMLCHQIA